MILVFLSALDLYLILILSCIEVINIKLISFSSYYLLFLY